MRQLKRSAQGFWGAHAVYLPVQSSARCSTIATNQDGDRLRSQKPVYYNFATIAAERRDTTAFGSQRRHRRSMSFRLADDNLPNENVSAGDASDPYHHIRIFRREVGDGGHGPMGTASTSTRGGSSLSIDVPQKKFLDMFCDYDGKRCKLCNESFLHWHAHQNAIPHSGREGILLELVRAYCGTPEEIYKMWVYRLNHCSDFPRLRELGHSESHERKRRIQYLLHFLKDRCILIDTFNVMQNESAGAGRSWEFERLEWVGDNVVKYVLNNRLNCLFPVREGGIRGKLGYFQFVIDGNDGLARAYDYLELQSLTRSQKVVSKFKSDVVETLFGELQLYLWSTELDLGIDTLTFPFSREMYTVRAVVNHVMEELANVLVLYHIEYILGMLQRVVRENQIQYTRADPLQQRSDGGSYGSGEFGNVGPSSRAGVAATSVLTSSRVQRSLGSNGSASLFLESTNYDNYKRVTPIGGLLPRPFGKGQLAVIPNYMPHIQRDEALTRRIVSKSRNWSALVDSLSSKDAAEATSTESGSSMAYNIAQCPHQPPPHPPEGLTIPRMKDEELIAELA